MTPKLRWMIRRDMPSVLDIEAACFDSPWNEDDFNCCLRQRNCIGYVAEYDETVLGFMVYELLKNELHVLNVAVHPNHQRQGVGTAMIERLKIKLEQQRRRLLTFDIRESNLRMQLWLRDRWFAAIKVLRNHYENDESAYRFQYRLESAEIEWKPANRISEFVVE